MIEIIKELSVEVTKPNIFQALVAKQYDMNTRFLKVTLMDCGTRIDVPYIETAKVVINAERKDGQSKGFDGVINEDGTVTVPLHSWMLELEGTVICDISVMDTAIDNNKKLTTTSFTLIVEKAAYGGDDITSDPQFDVLVALLEAAPTAQEALDVSNQALAKSAEANEKYEACVEATENANKVREEIEAGGYIESLKELNKGSKFTIWIGTTKEYKALTEIKTNCLYIKTDDTSMQDIKNQIESLEKDVESLEKVTVDYIVEQGTDDIWAYEKRASGIAECSACITVPVSELVRWDEYHYFKAIGDFEFPKIDGNPLFATLPVFHYDIGNYQTTGFGRGSVYTLREGHNSASTGMLYIAGISKVIDQFEELYTREDGLKVYRPPEDLQVMISLTAKGRWKFLEEE